MKVVTRDKINRDKIKNYLWELKRYIDMSATGASIHDMNACFYQIRHTAIFKSRSTETLENIRRFRNAMSAERGAFRGKTKNIMEMWDLLDNIVNEIVEIKKEEI